MEMSESSGTGVAAIVAFVYCVMVNGCHFYLSKTSKPRQSVFGRRLTLWSHLSMVCMSLAPLFMIMSFFHPEASVSLHGSGESCFCKQWYAFAVISFASGLFLLKINYLARLNMVSSPGKVDSFSIAVRVYFTLLVIEAITVNCIQYAVIDASCNTNSQGDFEYGCVASFDSWNGFMALGLLVHDCAAYYLFCVCYMRKTRAKLIEKQSAISITNKAPSKTFETPLNRDNSSALFLRLSPAPEDAIAKNSPRSPENATATQSKSSKTATAVVAPDDACTPQSLKVVATDSLTPTAASGTDGHQEQTPKEVLVRPDGSLGATAGVNKLPARVPSMSLDLGRDNSQSSTNSTSPQFHSHASQKMTLRKKRSLAREVSKLQLIYKGLIRQFRVTLLAILVCIVDLVVNTICQDYNWLWVFMIDTMVCVTLNFLAFRDSHYFVKHHFFWMRRVCMDGCGVLVDICCCMRDSMVWNDPQGYGAAEASATSTQTATVSSYETVSTKMKFGALARDREDSFVREELEHDKASK